MKSVKLTDIFQLAKIHSILISSVELALFTAGKLLAMTSTGTKIIVKICKILSFHSKMTSWFSCSEDFSWLECAARILTSYVWNAQATLTLKGPKLLNWVYIVFQNFIYINFTDITERIIRNLFSSFQGITS